MGKSGGKQDPIDLFTRKRKKMRSSNRSRRRNNYFIWFKHFLRQFHVAQLASNSWSFCISLHSSGIKDMYHHVQLKMFIYLLANTIKRGVPWSTHLSWAVSIALIGFNLESDQLHCDFSNRLVYMKWMSGAPEIVSKLYMFPSTLKWKGALVFSLLCIWLLVWQGSWRCF